MGILRRDDPACSQYSLGNCSNSMHLVHKKKIAIFLLAFTLAMILAATLAVWWVNAHPLAISRYLDVSQTPEKADVIVVPSGDDIPRLAKAAELYSKGYASRILITGFSKASIAQFQKKYAIPESVLITEPSATTTFLNATRSAPLLSDSNAHTVILVTSWYHSRRTLNTFRHVMPKLRFISVPTHDIYWPVNDKTFTLEFWKLCYYSIAYRVSPW